MKTTVDAQNTGLTLIPRRSSSSRYPQINLPDQDYADDIALFLEENEMSMAKTTEAIRQSVSKLGLMIRYEKTEFCPLDSMASQS